MTKHNPSKINEQGTVLLVMLAVISVLLVSSLQLTRLVLNSVTGLRKENQVFQAREMAMSGIHLSMMILADDAAKQDTDSIQEDWADQEKLDQMVAQLGFEAGNLTLKIDDEQGKLQVNALLKQFPGYEVNQAQYKLWERLLALLISTDKSKEEQDPTEIINSLKDWLDSKDDEAVTGLTGAESDYYLGRELPYTCSNGPINCLEELVLVKGISPDLFISGTKEVLEELENNHSENAVESDFGDLLTCFGMSETRRSETTFFFPGRININTANPVILKILLPERIEDLAQDLVDFRKERSQDGETFVNVLDKEWYTKVIDLSKDEKASFDGLIRYSSHIFRVSAKANFGEAQAEFQAYVQRYQQKESNQWACRILQLKKG